MRRLSVGQGLGLSSKENFTILLESNTYSNVTFANRLFTVRVLIAKHAATRVGSAKSEKTTLQTLARRVKVDKSSRARSIYWQWSVVFQYDVLCSWKVVVSRGNGIGLWTRTWRRFVL
jgi:hypothetical protein